MQLLETRGRMGRGGTARGGDRQTFWIFFLMCVLAGEVQSGKQFIKSVAS